MIVVLGVLVFVTVAVGVPVTPDRPQPVAPVQPRSGVSPFKDVVAPDCTTRDNVTVAKNGMINTRYRWTNFNVHPDKAYNQQELQAINDAMYKLSQVIPCVRFGIWPQDSTPTGDYIKIVKGTSNGCNSYVGRQGGQQIMNLQSPGCMGVGTIMHECIHALGFHHEHGRPDRDDYVNILNQNMEPGMEYAFEKYSTSETTTFGVTYNFRSIMHYGSWAFSKNGQPTITTKSGGTFNAQRDELQETDKQKLKKMYNC